MFVVPAIGVRAAQAQALVGGRLLDVRTERPRRRGSRSRARDGGGGALVPWCRIPSPPCRIRQTRARAPAREHRMVAAELPTNASLATLLSARARRTPLD